jgi:hypothetical protein
MSSPDELRSYAVDCARLAKAAIDPHDSARLLNMARAWTDLADRLEKMREVTVKVAPPEDVDSPVSSTMPPGAGGAATEERA